MTGRITTGLSAVAVGVGVAVGLGGRVAAAAPDDSAAANNSAAGLRVKRARHESEPARSRAVLTWMRGGQGRACCRSDKLMRVSKGVGSQSLGRSRR